MVERLCARYGKLLGTVSGVDFYTFPELEALCAATVRSMRRAARRSWVTRSVAIFVRFSGSVLLA